MRLVFFPALCLLAASCTPSVTLYTDEIFRAAAPEIMAAWKGSVPWKSAITKEVAPGAGRAVLEADLALPAPPSIVLVGMALSGAERIALQNAHPATRMLFFTAPGGPPGMAELVIGRQEAWTTVAVAAAKNAPKGAVVFYPTDVTAQEMHSFDLAWTEAGGGTLVTAVGYKADLLQGTLPVFDWAGPELDGPILALKPTVPVHGNPGLVRAQGAGGLTWTVKESGLGDFLWNAALDPEKKVHFLPLETVLDHR